MGFPVGKWNWKSVESLRSIFSWKYVAPVVVNAPFLKIRQYNEKN